MTTNAVQILVSNFVILVEIMTKHCGVFFTPRALRP